jgi:gas vesicle protein
MPLPKKQKLASQSRIEEDKEFDMAAQESPIVANTDAPEGANVDKIRDILFGSQMREYEKRFGRLEEQVASSLETIRQDIKRRFDSLEAFTHQEVESLSQRLKNEKGERVENVKELTAEMRSLAASLQNKLSQLEEQMTSGQGDLRTRILDQTKSLSNEIERTKKDFSAVIDREVQTLRSEKTDRATLADLFNELALRLNNGLTLPDK